MQVKRNHRWDLSPRQAVALQRELAASVIQEEFSGHIRLVAGADVHPAADGRLRAFVCVLSFPELAIVEECSAERTAAFPYVPGLLSFREGPPLLECFRKLKKRPDLILFDGQGIAHPRRFGIASHIGVLLDVPSIGCAKSPLYGSWILPGPRKGNHSPIRDETGAIIGECVRSRDNVKPLFVSVGHRVSLGQAVEVVLRCLRGFRLPEPLRLAHRMAKSPRR